MNYLDIGSLTKKEYEFIDSCAKYVFNSAMGKFEKQTAQSMMRLFMEKKFKRIIGHDLDYFTFGKYFFVVVPGYQYDRSVQGVVNNILTKYKVDFYHPSTGYNIINLITTIVEEKGKTVKHKMLFHDIRYIMETAFRVGLEKLSEYSITGSIFTSEEYKNITDYLILRKMRPETEKHFGDILTNL